MAISLPCRTPAPSERNEARPQGLSGKHPASAPSMTLPTIRRLVPAVRTPPLKAVCPDLLTGVKSMAYVMRYNHFPH